jgi:hypothetical protein
MNYRYDANGSFKSVKEQFTSITLPRDRVCVESECNRLDKINLVMEENNFPKLYETITTLTKLPENIFIPYKAEIKFSNTNFTGELNEIERLRLMLGLGQQNDKLPTVLSKHVYNLTSDEMKIYKATGQLPEEKRTSIS